jgi:3-hydroxy-9,10-secoandrosta-1,3,5(10)-triene-9,17-dione monooxygenase reductase component
MPEHPDGNEQPDHPEQPDPLRFRHVLGQFATGVTVVTSTDGDTPVGFACQAFAALSLDPPMVLFCPSKGSGSWPAMEQAGRFCVNVLGEGQREVSQVFGTRGADKFASVRWTRSEQGLPVLEGVLSWIDCSIEAVHTAGDHYVVIGRVLDLGTSGDDRPLLFYRGDYTAADVPQELLASAGPADPELTGALLETLMSWPRQQDWI